MASSGLQHLVLVGTGLAHLQVLKSFAERRSAGLKITVVGTTTSPVYFDRVPDFVTGACPAPACAVPLDNLLQSCGAVFIQATVEALDANTKTLRLSHGEPLHYDVLSVDTAPMMPRALLDTQLPGATQHAMNLYPLASFCKLWPQLSALAKTRALNVAVVAGSVGYPRGELQTDFVTDSTEPDLHKVHNMNPAEATHTLPAVALALAIQHSLACDPDNQPSRVTLVTGGGEPAALCPSAVQKHLLAALKRQHITVLRDRCTSISTTELRLVSGTRLACDAPVLALDTPASYFWSNSGVELYSNGFPAINFNLQSVNQTCIFITPTERDDTHATAISRLSVRTGPLLTPLLAYNLRAALDSIPMKPCPRPTHSLKLFSSGHRRAIAAWRSPWSRLTLEGTWVWQLWRWRCWTPHVDMPIRPSKP